jgi:hypothetical protein
MDTEDQINDTATQNDTMDNNMIAMLNSLMSRNLQQESKSIQKDEDSDDDEEAEEDSDEEDSDDDEEWIALQKLLDSHLRITKCLLHLVKKK